MSGGWGDEYDYDEEYYAEMTEATVPLEDGDITISVKANALNGVAREAASMIAKQLSEKVLKMVDARLDDLLDEAWEAAIAKRAQEKIDEYLTTPRAKTNQYGERTGGSITFAEKIPQAVDKYLQQRVNKDGRDEDYNGSIVGTRMEWMIKKFVTDEIKGETEKAAKAVTEKARAVVQHHVARFISEQMVPAIELNPDKS